MLTFLPVIYGVFVKTVRCQLWSLRKEILNWDTSVDMLSQRPASFDPRVCICGPSYANQFENMTHSVDSEPLNLQLCYCHFLILRLYARKLHVCNRK